MPPLPAGLESEERPFPKGLPFGGGLGLGELRAGAQCAPIVRRMIRDLDRNAPPDPLAPALERRRKSWYNKTSSYLLDGISPPMVACLDKKIREATKGGFCDA